MPLLDDRGRLFGRFNLIDAAIGLFVLALIPLAYASWLLFRIPPPMLDAITPTTIRAGVADQLIDVRGRNLRPYLHLLLDREGTEWLFSTPERASAKVPGLRPGSYDVVLYDEAIEVGRIKKGLTVATPPVPVEAPTPTVTSVTPREIEYLKVPQRVDVKGTFLRLGLRVMVGTQQADYNFESPERATLNVPQLPPDTYNLVLFEGIRELFRYPKAITVPPPVVNSISPKAFEFTRQQMQIQLHGAHLQSGVKFFLGFKQVDVDFVSPEHVELRPQGMPAGVYDLRLTDDVRQLAVYPKAITIQAVTNFPVVEAITPKALDYTREQQSVEVKGKYFKQGMSAFIGYQRVGAIVETGERMRVNVPALPPDAYDLWIGDDQGVELTRAPKAVIIQQPEFMEVVIKVRFTVRPDLVKKLKAQLAASPGERQSSTYGPVLLSADQDGEPVSGSAAAEILAGPRVAVNCTIRLMATKRPDGPQWDGKPLKIGSSFTFNGPDYILSSGDVTSVENAPAR